MPVCEDQQFAQHATKSTATNNGNLTSDSRVPHHSFYHGANDRDDQHRGSLINQVSFVPSHFSAGQEKSFPFKKFSRLRMAHETANICTFYASVYKV